ncbi:MAG: PilZ domain-containing protein [Acidimicrobiales bacterium]
MQVAWKPTPGQLALIEPSTGDKECLTGVVVEDDGTDVVIDLGASPHPPETDCEVVASFFAPDALYRLKGIAHPHAGRRSVIDLTVAGIERVQRRAAPRAREELVAVLSNLDEPSGELVSIVGRTVDIGTGGCRIRADEAYPLGGDPTITITLPDDTQVIALAAILQARAVDDEWEYRLVFLEVDDDSRFHLAAFVDGDA